VTVITDTNTYGEVNVTGEHEEVIVSKTAVDTRVHELGERETVTARVLLKELESLSGGEGLGGASGVRRGGNTVRRHDDGRRRRASRWGLGQVASRKVKISFVVVLSQEEKKEEVSKVKINRQRGGRSGAAVTDRLTDRLTD
jgi:hypothetical protein